MQIYVPTLKSQLGYCINQYVYHWQKPLNNSSRQKRANPVISILRKIFTSPSANWLIYEQTIWYNFSVSKPYYSKVKCYSPFLRNPSPPHSFILWTITSCTPKWLSHNSYIIPNYWFTANKENWTWKIENWSTKQKPPNL